MPNLTSVNLTGTASQIEWALLIRAQISAEFDRVANALTVAAEKQTDEARSATREILAILEDHRTAVLANERAGYFIKDWQELDGKVRQLLAADPRYRAVKARLG